MRFDDEGHVEISPIDVQDQLHDCDGLINQCLLPGTPRVFTTHKQFHTFLSFIADELYIPPMNVCVRGSSKIGFSIAPRPEKIWMAPGPNADLDVGIVDIDYFNAIDREVKRWMRTNSQDRRRIRKMHDTRKRDYYRYFDLPQEIGIVAEHNDCFRRSDESADCVNGRIITGFVYRDWWSVTARYKFDLEAVRDGLRRATNCLPAATTSPRSYEPPVDTGGREFY